MYQGAIMGVTNGFLRLSVTLLVVCALCALLGSATGPRRALAAGSAESASLMPALATETFTIKLTGAAEVDAAGQPNKGDLNGTGTATLTLDSATNEICYTLNVANITLPASAAHIH
jgi:hypothetical protein